MNAGSVPRGRWVWYLVRRVFDHPHAPWPTPLDTSGHAPVNPTTQPPDDIGLNHAWRWGPVDLLADNITVQP